jgi:hypothetical protein
MFSNVSDPSRLHPSRLDPSRLPVRFLAEQAVAADLFRAIVDAAANAATEPAAMPPSMHALLTYTKRPRGAPADFAIEQAIRTDPAVSRRYRNLLAVTAQASSPVALAAATGAVPGRLVGKWQLRISAPDGLWPVLVLERQDAAPAPAAIEAVGRDGRSVRLRLPEPVNQAIQVSLDGDVCELAEFHRLIADPETEIFLLG